MKNLLSWMSAAACLGLPLLLATPAAAQAPAIRAEVPFTFTVCDQVLPPGEYEFLKEGSSIRITRTDSTKIWLARVVGGGEDRSSQNLDKGMLRFDRHGDRYLLRGMWRAGATSSYAVMPSRVPREYSRADGGRDVLATR